MHNPHNEKLFLEGFADPRDINSAILYTVTPLKVIFLDWNDSV